LKKKLKSAEIMEKSRSQFTLLRQASALLRAKKETSRVENQSGSVLADIGLASGSASTTSDWVSRPSQFKTATDRKHVSFREEV
jgi:hypothetical protein